MQVHLRRQIDLLKRLILRMGGQVEEAVAQSIDAIRDRDIDLAEQIIAGDEEIDRIEVEIEEECLHTIALHQPVAFDIRYVISVLKINNDLERIGDLAVHIAELARMLATEPELEELPFDFSGMSEKVQAMLKRSLDALVNVDVDLAQAVREADDEVDQIHLGVYERAVELMKQQPDKVSQIGQMTAISRNLERIADHCVNIAEDVLYLSKGEIYRHQAAERLDSENSD